MLNCEANTSRPEIRDMPAIISFLGYNALPGQHSGGRTGPATYTNWNRQGTVPRSGTRPWPPPGAPSSSSPPDRETLCTNQRLVRPSEVTRDPRKSIFSEPLNKSGNGCYCFSPLPCAKPRNRYSPRPSVPVLSRPSTRGLPHWQVKRSRLACAPSSGSPSLSRTIPAITAAGAGLNYKSFKAWPASSRANEPSP